MLVTCLVATALSAPEPVAPVLDQDFVEKVNRNWRGLGLGYDNGLWGDSFAQGIKVDIPFGPKIGQFAGVRLRGVVAHGDPPPAYQLLNDPSTGPDRVRPLYLTGGELFGRGPVWGGIVRAYGGGGAYYGSTQVWSHDLYVHVTGAVVGGHFGVEAILWKRGSFTLEVGGQSGLDGLPQGSGASVMGGIMVYLGDLGA
jgi:hypothetical protein